MSASKRFYSYSQDTKAVAYVDIIGFSHLTRDAIDENAGTLAFTLFENCVLNYRESMKTGTPFFPREVSADLKARGHREGFWYQEVPEGAVNFLYVSDGLILYSSSMSHLLRELSAIFGAAIIFGVPIRGAISVGDVHHSEWVERPGTAICLYGGALTRAALLEKKHSGAGMTVFLDSEAEKLALAIPATKSSIIPSSVTKREAELKWWLNAIAASEKTNCKKESDELAHQFKRWFTEKHTKDWFTGKNRVSTEDILCRGVEELRQLGR